MSYKGRITSLIIILLGYSFWTYYVIVQYGSVWGTPGKFLFNVVPTLLELCIGWWIGLQFDKVKFLSERDMLTGVYNRRYVYSLFAKKPKRLQQGFTVFLVDVDHFKDVNDIYGHRMGDKVLQSLAYILRRHVRKEDLVVRWGGDEFLIIAFGGCDPAVLIERWDGELQSLSKELGFHVSISVGQCSVTPNSLPELDVIVQGADEEMYVRKKMSFL
ncbi:MAG: GGDEF domain-containing protein [Ectobacillus sp.]